ncbi:MAK10-like protein [Tanacetum coccineum]
MGDENHIRTLGDYSKPSHEGYKNTIELSVGNNVVPLRSDTIRLVQNGFSFHGLRSEDPNQHVKDFLKLVDSLDLDTSNWLERLPARSITTWEDLTTRFLAQFFPPGRTAKLRNDILMFQQHHGESLSEAWTHFKDLLQKSLIMASTFGFKSKFFMTMTSPSMTTKVRTTQGILLSQSRHFALRCPEYIRPPPHQARNQVQRLMEAHLAPLQPTQVNKITTICEICSGPLNTQYCMEDPKQAFVEYASSRTDEARDARLFKFEADFKQQQSEMTNKINIVLKAITDQITGTLPSDTVKNPKLNTFPVLSARSYPTEDPQRSTHVHCSINAITIHPKQPEGSQVNRPDKRQEDDGNLGNTNPNSHPQPDPLASITTKQVIFDEKKLGDS